MVKTTRKKAVVLTTIITLILLAGCSSAKMEDGQVETTIPVKVVTSDEKTEIESVEEKETEVTEEEIPSVIYEGIDMESTLPGEEWIETFVGIIDEPKFVVFNDSTNRKVIVEEEQKIKFDKNSDTFAIYLPDEYENMSGLEITSVWNINEHSLVVTEWKEQVLEEKKGKSENPGEVSYHTRVWKVGEDPKKMKCILDFGETEEVVEEKRSVVYEGNAIVLNSYFYIG